MALPPTPWTVSEDGIVSDAVGRPILVLGSPDEEMHDWHLDVLALVLAAPGLLVAADGVLKARLAWTARAEAARHLLRTAVDQATDVDAMRRTIHPAYLAQEDVDG
jgi:ADP-ribose pyrophosphatase YjhB (NUDIX family)